MTVRSGKKLWASRFAHPVAADRGQAGFSLVELVVAIAIGGVLLAVAFNGQSLLGDRRLTGMARKLAADMRMAEQRARSERTCYRIVFDPAGESYDIDRYDPSAVAPAPPGGGNQCPGGAWTSAVFRENSGDAVSRRMPRAVDLVSTTFGSDTVVWSPLGNPPGGTVTLRSAGGATRRVVVEPLGRVSIQQ